MSESLATDGTEGKVTPATPLMVAVRVEVAFGGPALSAGLEAAPAAGALALESVPKVLQLTPSGLPSMATTPPLPNVPETENFACRTPLGDWIGAPLAF